MKFFKTFAIIVFVLLYTNNSLAQDVENKSGNDQPQNIIKRINSMVKEYVFSIGVSKYEPFILNGYIVKQGEYTFNLKKVKIYRVEVGLKVLCFDMNNDCIKTIDSKTHEISYEPWVLYSFNDEEISKKLLIEFCRLKNILNIGN